MDFKKYFPSQRDEVRDRSKCAYLLPSGRTCNRNPGWGLNSYHCKQHARMWERDIINHLTTPLH